MTINTVFGARPLEDRKRSGINELRKRSFDREFKPTTGEVASSFVSETFKGIGSAFALSETIEARQSQSQELSPEEYKNSDYYREGLEYTRGLNSDLAELRAENYDRRQRNSFVISRATGGQKAFGMLTGVLSGFLEPANIASAAILPVFPAATFARLANKSKNLARVTKGATEGLAGQAVLEPLARYTAEELQEDYTMTDSLLNIAASSFFGAGLNVAGGKVADKFHDRKNLVTPKKHKEALFEAVNDLVEGRSVNVENNLNTRSIGKYKTARELLGEQRESFDLDFPVRKITNANGKEVNWRYPLDLISFIRTQGGVKDQGGELKTIGLDNTPRKGDLLGNENILGKLIKDDGLTLDEMALKAYEAGYFPELPSRPEINDFLSKIDKTAKAQTLKDRVFIPDEIEGKITNRERDLEQEAAFLGIDTTNKSDDQIALEIQKVEDLKQVEFESKNTVPPIENKFDSELNGELGDYEFSNSIEEGSDIPFEVDDFDNDSYLKTISREESLLKSEVETIESYKKQGLIDDEDLEVLAEYDKNIKDSENLSQRIEEIANCIVGT